MGLSPRLDACRTFWQGASTGLGNGSEAMKTVRLIALALTVLGVVLFGHGHSTAFADGEHGTLYIDVYNTDGASAATTFGGVGTIDVCRDTDDLGGPLEIGDTFSIDIIVDDATNTISGATPKPCPKLALAPVPV